MRGVFALALCAAAWCCAGCRLWEIDPLWNGSELFRQQQQTSRLTDALADALDADAWTENRKWSPVTERSSTLRSLRNAPADARWLFRPAQSPLTPRPGIDGSPIRMAEGGKTSLFSLADIVETYGQPGRDLNFATGEIEADSLATPVAETPRTIVGDEIVFQLSLIARRDELAGWNAAILLAQHNPIAARPFVPLLARLAADPPMIAEIPHSALDQTPENGAVQKRARQLSADMRAAAAEAWCLVLATAETGGEQAMRIPGLVLEDNHRSRDSRRILSGDLPMSVEAELIRGIGRRVAPARIHELALLLKRPLSHQGKATAEFLRRAKLHHAALDACLLYAVHRRGIPVESGEQDAFLNLHDEEIWPRVIWNCGDDPDPRVRAGFGLLLAVAGDERALDVLADQVSDSKAEVQRRALQNLGLLRSEAAREKLQIYMTRKSLLRKTAVQGLAAFGEAELVKHILDEDARVREELARQLTPYHSRTAAVALATLMTDSVTAVQSTVIDGLESWPDELLLPLLLHGAVEGNYRTRHNSLMMYSQRTGTVVPPFRADDDYATRQKRAAHTARRAAIAYPWTADPLALMSGPEKRIDRERTEEIKRRLQIAVSLGGVSAGGFESEWFRQLKSADLPAVEQVLRQSDSGGREYLFREVLPHLAPEYEALLDIEHTNVTQRRAAAAKLRVIGQERSLRAPVWEKLSDVLVREEDAAVWREVIAAIKRDTAEPVTRIVQLAVNHRWADVRRMGCQYVQQHGRPDFAPWMQRLFQDPHPTVQLAAIKAAGRCGQQRVLEDVHDADGEVTMIGLSRLLNSFTGDRHLAVVESMSRLLDPRGLDELQRLSYSGSWPTRMAAIEVMAATGQTRFLDRLIDVLWLEQETRPEVQRAALSAIESMIPAGEHPSELQSAQHPRQQAEVWRLWWERRSRKNPTNPAPAAGNRYNRATRQQAT